MNFSYGLLGIRETIKEIAKEQKNKPSPSEREKAMEREMEEFCEKTAAKYGINRGTDLLALQYSLAQEGYYETVRLKNEEAIEFLEQEKEDILRRKHAMIERIRKLPVEGIFDLDESDIQIGRNGIINREGGYNQMLSMAEKYIENNGVDFPVEEYLQKIYRAVPVLVEEIEKDIGCLQKGKNGEEYVNQQLKLYEGKYRVLKNIVLESEDSQGKTSEVDVYIITDKGLVVAEIKNLGNENKRLHISSDGRWVIENAYDGEILEKIDRSPVEQNTRHCLAVERLLKQELGKDCQIPIIPVIFMANNEVSILNESRSAVIRVSEFYTFINSVQGGAVSEEMQEKVEKLLVDHNIGAQKFSVTSRRRRMDNLEDMEREFTKYVLYNNDIALKYSEVVKRNAPVKKVKERKIQMPSLTTIAVLLLPYLPILFMDWTGEFRIVLLVGYTLLLYNIPLGLLAGAVLFFLLIIIN